MADYIDRDKAIKEIQSHQNDSESIYFYEGIRTAWEVVEQFPSADVKPVVHGKWELTTEQIGFPKWNCSCCGGEGRGDYWFCPWCGADMRGKC